jgi:cation diffusion facilitator family transporter
MDPLPAHVRRQREVRRVLLVTLVLNVAVAVAKLVIGTLSRSLAMVADGYHSLLDGSSNIVGLVAIHFAHKPPDEDHQYGHRKFETVSAMAISVSLFAAAFRILSDVYHRLGTTVTPSIGVASFAVMLGTIAVNVGVSTYEAREGRRLHSSFLLSDSAHTGSDVYASIAVLVSLLAARLGIMWVDVIASIGIAIVIVRTGYHIVLAGMRVIADQIVLDPKKVEETVRSIEGVRSCARIRTRGTEDHVFMDLVVYVPGDLTLNDAHALADRIEGRIQQAYPEVKDIVVHLEPAEG